MLLACHGTWNLHDFWRSTSTWNQRARERGFVTPEDPFVWSGELVITDHTQWIVAASSLTWYCRAYRLEAPDICTLSHGIQVQSYAAKFGQRFGHVLDIEGPPRLDMEDVYQAARRNMKSWVHTYSHGDTVIIAGQVGEGKSDPNYTM